MVHPTAKVGKNAHLGPYVVIDESAEIGDNAVLLAHVVVYRGAKIGSNFFAHAHAVVREFCRLGDNVLLQNGVIVGCDGFGFAKDDSGHWHKIIQSGNVVIENDVELQANTCIDRASIGETRIARGAKLDNLVHVGHSCTIGQDTLLCAQVGLAGTTDVGNKVILLGQVGVSGHVQDRRRRRRHRPKRHPARRSRRGHGQRRPRHRSQTVVEVLRGLREAAGDRQGSKEAAGAGFLNSVIPSAARRSEATKRKSRDLVFPLNCHKPAVTRRTASRRASL